MDIPEGSQGTAHRPDLRGSVRRAHVVLHVVVALLLIVAGGLPLMPRLSMALVSLGIAAAPNLGPSLPAIGRTELVALSNVLGGFIAFVVLPEAPALSFALAMVGLVAAAIVARPLVERAVVGVAIVLEIVKIPIVVGGTFTSSVPFLSDVLRHPLDLIAGSLIQSIVLLGIFGIVHVVAGVVRRAQHALVDSEARYRMLTEALPNAAMVVVDGKVAFANRAAQALLGDVAVSVVGHYLEELIPDGVIPGLKAAIGDVRRGGPPRELSGNALGDAKQAVHLNASLSSLEFDGDPAVMVVVSDISERYAAEQARREGEARFRAAFFTTATPFVLLTPEATVLDLNDAALKLLGRPRSEAIGERWEEYMESADIAAFREFAGAATTGILDHFASEAVLVTGSGDRVRAELDITVDRDMDGNLRNYFAQIHDVTARHNAEQALRVNEKRYRSLFERSPVALYRTTPSGEIVDVNRSLLDLMGYDDKQDLLALEANEVYADPDERMRIRDLLDRDGFLDGRESEVIRADGSRIWVRDTATLVEVDGERYIEGSLVEVTARRRADSLLRRAAVQGETVAKLGHLALTSSALDELFAETVQSLATVLDVATTGIVVPGEGGVLDTVATVGWPGDDDRTARDRIDALVGFAAGATRPVVVTPPSPGGSEQSAVAVAVRGADRVLGVVVALDPSGRPVRPDGLHFLRSVANVLAAAIDRHESRSQLEQLVRSKDEFIASISHELRTPLTVVAGMAHELRDQWDQFDRGEIEELIALMVDQSNDMRNLIEDLLVAARADIGKVPVHNAPVDVAPSIEAVLSALPATNGASIRAELASVTALADPTRLRQIVRNLVTNALRYGGTTITVASGAAGDRAFVRVHDDGPGIPEHEQPRMFEPYESIHEAVGTPGSVGLGLTISRKLARLMGGDLTYRLADGSLFELSLPIAEGAGAPAQATDTDDPISWSSLLA